MKEEQPVSAAKRFRDPSVLPNRTWYVMTISAKAKFKDNALKAH
jgi:hypothetical protein